MVRLRTIAAQRSPSFPFARHFILRLAGKFFAGRRDPPSLVPGRKGAASADDEDDVAAFECHDLYARLLPSSCSSSLRAAMLLILASETPRFECHTTIDASVTREEAPRSRP